MAARFQHGQQVLIRCMPFLDIAYEKGGGVAVLMLMSM